MPNTNPYVFFSLLAFLLCAAAALTALAASELSVLAAYVIGINVGAFFVMGLDKALSKRGSLRPPETVLYVLAMLGGSPGVVVAMNVLRHKTKKASFQLALLIIFTVQVAVARYLQRYT